MEATPLTPNALKMLHDVEQSDISEWAPRVQCITIKQLSSMNEAATPRYRYVLQITLFTCASMPG